MSDQPELPKTSTIHWLRRIALAAAFWTVLGLIFALPNISAANGWRVPVLGALALWWSWGVVAPLIVAVDLRLPFSEAQLPKRIAVHVALSFVFTSLLVYVLASVRALLGLGPWALLRDPHLLPVALRGMFLWSWLIYCVIVGAWQAYRYYHRFLSSELLRERLERQFSQARLNALRLQLDPHFLFNALNTISSQVDRDPRLARRMIEHLGDLLRLSLECKDKTEVPLTEELAFLDHYLAIQKIRFGDNLNFSAHISPEVKYASVPNFFVQPLVENAIRHGISRRASGGSVLLTVERVDHQLLIRILDDGVGLPPGWCIEKSTGLGLSITRERIAALGSHGHTSFAIHNRPEGGTEVAISLPFVLQGENGHASPAI